MIRVPDWLYWHGGDWHESECKLLGMRDHSFWMGNAVFDGARAFAGVVPDLEAHCARAIRSAHLMYMQPKVSAEQLTDLCRDGVSRFASDDVLYIRPMFFVTGGFLVPDPDTTVTAIAIHRLAFPDPNGFSACFARQRRPRPVMRRRTRRLPAFTPTCSARLSKLPSVGSRAQ
jgi:branched-chain amino acid aminotransferase